jgi:hypothetical protein
MQVEKHVGIGSKHDVLDKRVLGGNDDVFEGESSCLPHGQCDTSEGERGQGGGLGEGGWHCLEQK